MENNVVKGFKVFRPDWSCRPDGNFKQYTCPGKFEEDITPVRCGSGMACRKANVTLPNFDEAIFEEVTGIKVG